MVEGCALQAWLCEPGQNGIKFLDGPKDRVRGGILLPNLIASPDLSISQSRVFGGPFRPRTNQAETPTHNMVAHRPGRDSNTSHDRVLPQRLPAASIPMQSSINSVDAVLRHHTSPYTTNLNPYHKPLGYLLPYAGDAGEEPDLFRALHNTPKVSPSSRTSSVSAIPDAYLPARSFGCGPSQFLPDSPYANHNSSISSSSSEYTPSSSRNQSGSSHVFQDRASGEAYKVIIRNVPAGVTHEDVSERLEQNMPYVQHETPKQGDVNKWSVEFSREEDAERAKERLHNLDFDGRKLKVHVSNGARRRQINSGSSTSSAASSSMTSGPTIIDGSVTG